MKVPAVSDRHPNVPRGSVRRLVRVRKSSLATSDFAKYPSAPARKANSAMSEEDVWLTKKDFGHGRETPGNSTCPLLPTSAAMQQKLLAPLRSRIRSVDDRFRCLAAACIQTLSGARISEFDSSVFTFTRWNPTFF
jgi:hypothetical protein